MKALSTLQNESFVKNHWKQSILQNKSFIKGLVPNASSSETGFGGVTHEDFDFMYGSISRLMASEFVGIIGRWEKLRGGV